MTNPIFTPNSVIIDGYEHPAGYSITNSGKVFVFWKFDGQGEEIRDMYQPGDAFYRRALVAAVACQCEREASKVEPQAERQAEEEPIKAEEEAPHVVAEPIRPSVKSAASEPVDKPWIGTSIKGKGWEICFDGVYGKTRVMFKKPPCAGVKQLVKDAGFFWSPTLKSWNKGLTCKAYRAAYKLAAYLRYYPNEPLFTEAAM